MLIESEYAGNAQLAACLTSLGHPTSVEQAMAEFMGLSGRNFIAAVERWIAQPLPDEFHRARSAEDERVLAEGIEAVAGAVAFVEALPDGLPRAMVSSSSTRWIRTHLDHLKLRHRFEPHIYSGGEDVIRGKPAPDLYLHAAARLGIPIGQLAVIEDSPVGVTGAVASGAFVIGLAAGRHCGDGHIDRLQSLGVHAIARDFAQVARILH